jgi:hypothetical protein
MTETYDPFKPPSDLDPGSHVLGDGTGYELSQWENMTIAKAAGRTKAWGVIALVVGVMFAAAIAAVFLLADQIPAEMRGAVLKIAAAVGIPTALVNLACGGLYIASGGALKAVVRTSGSDVPLLMTALGRMANAFRLEAVVGAAALIIGFVVGLMIGMEGGLR